MFYQRTIRKVAEVKGIGLHTGQPSQLRFCPAPADAGIHFVRRDLPGEPSVAVDARQVSATSLATVLGGEAFSVSTVEHCLSALAAFRIDNLFIELEGPEIPICDGSSKAFAEAIDAVGFVDQEAARNYVYITEPIYFGDADKHAYVVPYNGLRVTCTIDFPHPVIGEQSIDIDVNEVTYMKELASARTFGFLKDVEMMRARGQALGGSLENAIVLDEGQVMNPHGLRFPDEFVRHKALDALGDLVTLGRPMMGHLVLYKAGHDVMNKLIRQIIGQPQSFRSIELGSDIRREWPADTPEWVYS